MKSEITMNPTVGPIKDPRVLADLDKKVEEIRRRQSKRKPPEGKDKNNSS